MSLLCPHPFLIFSYILFPLPHPMHYCRFPPPCDSHPLPNTLLFSSLSSALARIQICSQETTHFSLSAFPSHSCCLCYFFLHLPSLRSICFPTPPRTHLSSWMSLSSHTEISKLPVIPYHKACTHPPSLFLYSHPP